MTQGQQKAPAGIYVVGVGVLLVGLLSFCCSAFAIFGQSQNQEAQLRQNPFVDQRMVEAILEAQETVFIPIVIAAVVSVLIALALLIFSAFTLARKPLAVHTPIALLVAAGWTLVDTGIALWSQTVQMDAMEPLMQGAGGAGESAAMDAGMAFGMTFAVCLYGGWALVKLALFVGGAVYLRKPEIQAHFTGGPPPGGYGGPPPASGGGYGTPPGGQGGGFGGPGGQGGGFGSPQGGQGGGFGGPQGGQGGGFGGPQGGQGGGPGGFGGG